MRCTNCGYESEENFAFCQRCGAAAPEVAPKNPAADRVFACLKDGLFLAVCILLTCSAALQILAGGLPVIPILAAIFTWLAYADAQKGMVNVKHLRRISGTTYAQYIIGNVGGVLFIVCGAIIVLIGAFMNELDTETIINLQMVIEEYLYEYIPEEALSFVFIIAGILMIVCGIATLVFNILAIRKIHRFIKSIYLEVKHGNTDFKLRSVKGWFITYAAFLGVSMTIYFPEDFLLLASTGCITAMLILSTVLVYKYFTKEQ